MGRPGTWIFHRKARCGNELDFMNFRALATPQPSATWRYARAVPISLQDFVLRNSFERAVLALLAALSPAIAVVWTASAPRFGFYLSPASAHRKVFHAAFRPACMRFRSPRRATSRTLGSLPGANFFFMRFSSWRCRPAMGPHVRRRNVVSVLDASIWSQRIRGRTGLDRPERSEALRYAWIRSRRRPRAAFLRA